MQAQRAIVEPYGGQEFLSIYAETLFHRPAITVHVVGVRPCRVDSISATDRAGVSFGVSRPTTERRINE
jgi:hypothetical protein